MSATLKFIEQKNNSPKQRDFLQLLREAPVNTMYKKVTGRYKSIELFAGAGGLALGLEKAGFDHIGLV